MFNRYLLTSEDERIEQPENFNEKLHLHQLTSIYRMKYMEKEHLIIDEDDENYKSMIHTKNRVIIR